jgi:hypothetical protein
MILIELFRVAWVTMRTGRVDRGGPAPGSGAARRAGEFE